MSSQPPDSSMTPAETDHTPAGPTAAFQPAPTPEPSSDADASPIVTSDYAPQPAPPSEQPSGPYVTPPTCAYSPKGARDTPPAKPKFETRPDKKSAAGPVSDDTGAAYGPSGRYVLKHFHAKGGMGEIWQAEDRTIGRVVALKRMRRPDKPTHRDQFLLEAQITGQLEHPGVVPVYELGWGDQEQPFYSMKFVQGSTLEKEVIAYHAARRKTKQADEVQWHRLLQVFVSLCQTVAYAHSRGVIHRDLKPENVMLGAYGETLVLDWGLAKVMDQPEQPVVSSSPSIHLVPGTGSKHTVAGSVKGTPAYMPPEMAAGRTNEADERSDVYLLGATLYQVLTGRSPRQGRSFLEIVEMARKEKPPNPRSYDKTIPRALEAICLKAMAYEPADRYSSALALAEDMQRYLAGEPVVAYPEPLLTRLGRWARRHRRLLVQAAAAVMVLVAAALGWVKIHDLEKSREMERRQTEELRAHEQGRRDAERFRTLADEARFYVAHATPGGDQAVLYDPGRAESTADLALRTVERYGVTLDDLAFLDELPELRRELYDLLIVLVKARLHRKLSAAALSEVRELLDRARLVGERTRGYYRLEAEWMRVQGQDRPAAGSQQSADDPLTPTSALDHFLLGEQARYVAARQSDLPDYRQSLEPDSELMARAIDHYREAMRLDPKDYWSCYQLGRCLLSLRQPDKAAEVFGTCVALRGEAPWAYSARAIALLLQRKDAEADRDVGKALSLNADLVQARMARGVLFARLDKHDAALKEFSSILDQPPDKRLPEAAFYRGQVLLQKGNYQEALQDFERVIGERADYRPPYEFRALTHFALGENDKGLTDLDAFLSGQRGFDTQNRNAFEQRGRLMRRFVHDLPQKVRRSFLTVALSQLKKAADEGGRSADLYADLGTVQEFLGRIDNAVESYSKGLSYHKDDAKLLVKRGWALAQLQRCDLAAADFLALTSKQPDHAEAHAGLGYVKACRKAGVEARREANLALLHGAGDYLILHNVACIYAALSEADPHQAKENQDLALAFLDRAVELWKRGGSGPNVLNYIENEPAFPAALRDRPEFQKLLERK